MTEYDLSLMAALVDQTRKKDEAAFAKLYALTQARIYNYARHYLRDDFLAQDAMQEVYILALKNLDQLKDSTLFAAWLNRIAFHVCYDMARKNRHTKEEIGGDEIFQFLPDEGTEHNPEANAEKKDALRRVREAVDALPFHEKQVIILRYYENRKLEEIAAACQISRSSVKRYIASAQEHLRELLKDEAAWHC